MKKLNKLLTLIIVICAFCCIPKQIANAKESYPQISMGKVYSFKVTHTKDSLSAFKLTKISSKAFRISASNTGGTSGYQVKYKQDGKNWKTLTVKASKLKKTIKKLKKKKTYRAKIRTYYTYKGKHIFSDWSRSKKISLK